MVPSLGVIYGVGLGVATIQTPQRPFPCDIRQWKVLEIAIDDMSVALLCTRRPQPYGLFVLPVGVTVLLQLHNPPRSWTSTVGPS
jgi:hypothetical protein